MFTAAEKIALARAAYYIAREVGDPRVQQAAVLAFRDALREERSQHVHTRSNRREARALAAAFAREYVPDWA